MNVRERAAQAERLAADSAFQALIQDVRNDAISQFLNSEPNDAEARDDAHAMVRALEKIEGRLAAYVDAFKIEQHKDRHRGND